MWDKIKDSKNTLLGVGPMSLNCTNAAIELANSLKIPMMLIASRRQIECASLGGGYVNNWATEEFAKYVKEQDVGGYIILARDHGSLWQGTNEQDLSYQEAFERALESYTADIDSQFDMIHIDPSIKERPLEDIKRDVVSFFNACEALSYNTKDLIYEVGSEEQSAKITDLNAFRNFVKFCSEISPKIKFVVGQTGTLVKETRNVGHFDDERSYELVDICNEYGMRLKEHNLDYVPEEVLMAHPEIGIHAANVAPEFGVVETRKFLEMLSFCRMEKERQRFLQIAYDSNKWYKWVISDLTNEEKAIIAGHYVFSNPEVQDIYNELNEKIYLDDVLKNEVKMAIFKYLTHFGWINNEKSH